MTRRHGPITRRTVLRGLGTAIALPWLETMASSAELAGRAAAAASAGVTPKRMAFLYVPNGVHMADWTPKAVGSDYEIPKTLEALAPYKDEMLVLTGLAQDNAAALGDGGGDHARSLACFLTGKHPLKTDGANIRAGVSADQVAAEKVGRYTRFPSLELGCDRGAQSGNCDSGYSCAYSSNISWRSESTPMAKEVNPRLVFDRLFANQIPGETAQQRAKRELYSKSILDFVAEDAGQLKTRLGLTDRRKLDEYLTSVRELELRISRSTQFTTENLGPIKKPTGIPQDYQEHIRLMLDLMVLAFQSDSTRISTFMYANEGSNKNYPFIGVSEGHHDLSHHGGNVEKHEKIKKINEFHIEQLAYFLGKLKSTREGAGSVLDNSMIVYGSGISDGNRHNHDDLPILLLGKGGGTVRPGRHIKYERKTPLNNLYLAMLERMGVEASTLGDSSGKLDKLS
jgi:hypothetical protein